MMQSLFSGHNPELVLFDLDGTLVDSVPDLACAIDAMLADLQQPPAGQARVATWVGNGAQTLVARALDWSGADPIETERALDLFLMHYSQHLAVASRLYAGVEGLLLHLQRQNIPMAIVTNKPIALTLPLLDALDIAKFFSIVVGGDSFAEKKPAPLPLLNVMAELSVVPEKTLMIGDSVNDVRAARSAGCPVVAVTYGYNHGESIVTSNPDLAIDCLDQLI